jgi:hypothetical protein
LPPPPAPPPAPTAVAPTPAPAAPSPRPAQALNNRAVGKAAAAFDILALAAALTGAVILTLELFVKAKG